MTNSCPDHTSHQGKALMGPAHRCAPSTEQTLRKAAGSQATLRPLLTVGSPGTGRRRRTLGHPGRHPPKSDSAGFHTRTFLDSPQPIPSPCATTCPTAGGLLSPRSPSSRQARAQRAGTVGFPTADVTGTQPWPRLGKAATPEKPLGRCPPPTRRAATAPPPWACAHPRTRACCP